MAQLLNIVENKETSEFYPTPNRLVRRMLDKIDWNRVKTVLEPSAGKGDILRGVARKADRRHEFEVDAIELDVNLRAILKYNFSEEAEEQLRDSKSAIIKSRGRYADQNWETKLYRYYDDKDGKYHDFPEAEQEQIKSLDYQLGCFFEDGIHIVHDDFLTYTAYKQYNAIVMNPPFSNGDRHLLKAFEMQQNGGQIVCLLNAETIRNPYTPTRKHLVSLLDKYNADIEYIESAFDDAERVADVEVALIYVDIPYSDEDGVSSIYDRMKKAKNYEEPVFEDCTELEVTDFIQAIVNRYRLEIESGIELIKTYNRMKPYLNTEFNPKGKYAFESAIIQLKDGNNHDMTVNHYVRSVRRKYWTALLTNEKFIGKLTTTLQHEYRERVSSYAEYDFSEFNIYTLVAEMNAKVKSGVEDEIEKMYDKLTEEHSYYPECQKNKHLYDGWKTNKAWKIVKKCILPCYGVFSSWDGKPRVYDANGTLSDIERILNFFDGNMTADVDLYRQLEVHFAEGVTKNIHCKFFDVTFYKKGTVHITFTCPELIDRYNIYIAKLRKWLPPSYGTKQYDSMTAEEQAVVDSFQGKEAYAKVMSRPDYYLASPVTGTDMLLIETKDEQRTA